MFPVEADAPGGEVPQRCRQFGREHLTRYQQRHAGGIGPYHPAADLSHGLCQGDGFPGQPPGLSNEQPPLRQGKGGRRRRGCGRVQAAVNAKERGRQPFETFFRVTDAGHGQSVVPHGHFQLDMILPAEPLHQGGAGKVGAPGADDQLAGVEGKEAGMVR